MGIYDRFIASSAADMKDILFYKAVLAELLGTFCLIFMVCASPYGESSTDLDHVRVSLSTGFVLASLIWILGTLSGADFNPAISISKLVTRKISLIRCIVYILVQCLGAVIGVYLLQALTCNWQVVYATTKLDAGENFTCGLGPTVLGPGVSPIQGMIIELLITFFLIITIFATIDSKRIDQQGSGALAVGLAAAGSLLCFIRQTGASMNPARTLGPANALGLWESHWVYWVGPILGGVIAGMLYEFIIADDASPQKIILWLTASDYGTVPVSPPDIEEKAEVESGDIKRGVSLISLSKASINGYSLVPT